MTLVWHIIAKDVRRLRLPLGLWLAVVLAHTGLLWLWTDAGMTRTAFEGLGIYLQMWELIVAAVGFILAAWLVMEDSLVETQAFWPTRPISGARLLAAKALGAAAMFGVAPVLALTPVWLACGFSDHEWLRAALAWMLSQGLLTLAAFALAVVTSSAGQFLIRAVGLAIGLPVMLLVASGRIAFRPYLVVRSDFSGGLGLEASKYAVAFGLTIAGATVLVVHRFLTRRTTRSVLLVAIWAALLVVVRCGWAWDFTASPERAGRNEASLKFAGKMTPGPTTNGRRAILFTGTITGGPAGTYVAPRFASARWVGAGGKGDGVVWLRRVSPAPQPPAHAVLAVLELPAKPPQPTAWALNGSEDGKVLEREKLEAVVTVGADLMRGRVLGRMRLNEGAVLRVGSSRTEVLRLEPDEGNISVFLRERDFALGEFCDAFVLFNRSTGQGRVMDLQYFETMQVNSIRVGERRLVLETPVHKVDAPAESSLGNLADWEILKVRFEAERIYSGPLAITVTH